MTLEERIAKLEKEFAEQLAELKAAVKQEKPATRFEPKENEYYAFINSMGGVMTTTPFEWLNSRTKFNNIFRKSSEDNLKKYSHDVLKVQNRLMQLHEELCPDYWETFNNFNETKYVVYLDEVNRVWCPEACTTRNLCVVHFTHDTAVDACQILNDEKFMMEDN